MAAPETVRVDYRNIDGVHVFTSEDVSSLYVADRDPGRAYEEVPLALHELLKFNKVDENAYYRASMSTAEFLKFIGYLDGSVPHPSVTAAKNVPYTRAV